MEAEITKKPPSGLQIAVRVFLRLLHILIIFGLIIYGGHLLYPGLGFLIIGLLFWFELWSESRK